MHFDLQAAVSKYQSSEISSPFISYGLVVLAICLWWKFTGLDNPSGLPVIGRRWYELGYGKAKQRFRDDCLGTVRSCAKKVSEHSTLIYLKMLSFEFYFCSMEMLSISIPMVVIA